MRTQQSALLALMIVGVMGAAWSGGAFAQGKYESPRGSPGEGASSSSGASRDDTPYRGSDRKATAPETIMIPLAGRRFIGDLPPQGPRRSPRRATGRSPSGAPPANERRFVRNEVLAQVASNISPQTLNAIESRHRLTRLEMQAFQLSGSTLVRWRINDRRSVETVVRELETDAAIIAAQPNYLYALRRGRIRADTQRELAQYELAKLHVPQAHEITKGDNVLVAVLDSGIDKSHPELAGSIAESFETNQFPPELHKHGTGVAAVIAAHGRLVGTAPKVRILDVRILGPAAIGSSYNFLKGLDWASAKGARVINMSYAGPADPFARQFMNAAYAKGIVLVAAAGNAGPSSPPLYPAAEPNVIAVTATDAKDQLYEQANRGSHIAVAAPGVNITLAVPGGGYEVSSGTSFATPQVSGIAALMLARKPDLTPDQVRAILQSTATDLGPKGPDSLFGAGLANAYGALMAEDPPRVAATSQPAEPVGTGAR